MAVLEAAANIVPPDMYVQTGELRGTSFGKKISMLISME
jgi:hypothetical protein